MSQRSPRPDLPGGVGWTSRSVGSERQHGVFYRLIRLGGRPPAYLLLYPVVLWYTFFRPDLGRRGLPYLRRRFPGRGRARLLAASFRLNLAVGKALVDRAVLGILGPGGMRVSFAGHEELLRLKGEGKGIVLLTAHVGSWQVAMSALGFLGMPVNLLLLRAPGDVDRHYFEHSGSSCPFNIIDPGGDLGGAIEMLAALRRREVVCIMGDRVLGGGRGALPGRFLGEEARFPAIPYKMAEATGAPIAVLFSHKAGPTLYRLELAGVLRVPPGEGGRDHLLPALAGFVEMLERFTGRHPFQFFNFFDMWGKDAGRNNHDP